jgi:hypothetical protein
MKLLSALGSLALLSGCMVHYGDRNAPGLAAIEVPPAASAPRRVERPEEPGQHQVLLSYGAFSGIGAAFGGAAGDQFVYALGPEISLARGFTEQTSRDIFLWPWMTRGYGLNLGWTALTRTDKPSVGPIYLEAELRFQLFTGALGWTVSPRNAAHGPQATFNAGPLYLRANHEFGGPTQLTIGILIKGYSAWFWNR